MKKTGLSRQCQFSGSLDGLQCPRMRRCRGAQGLVGAPSWFRPCLPQHTSFAHVWTCSCRDFGVRFPRPRHQPSRQQAR